MVMERTYMLFIKIYITISIENHIKHIILCKYMIIETYYRLNYNIDYRLTLHKLHQIVRPFHILINCLKQQYLLLL